MNRRDVKMIWKVIWELITKPSTFCYQPFLSNVIMSSTGSDIFVLTNHVVNLALHVHNKAIYDFSRLTYDQDIQMTIKNKQISVNNVILLCFMSIIRQFNTVNYLVIIWNVDSRLNISESGNDHLARRYFMRLSMCKHINFVFWWNTVWENTCLNILEEQEAIYFFRIDSL